VVDAMTALNGGWRPPGYVVGLDGKIYPGTGLHSTRVSSYLFGRCHYERHDNGLSYRQIIATLADEGWRISVGTVAAYLKSECVACSGSANETPEHLGGAVAS
jgi:hypothetical protein